MAHKEGYEATPLLSGGAVAAPAQPQEPLPRKWHGHLLNPFGSCDALGWSTCLITHYMPCVTFGVTNRKAFAKSALRSGLIFATLVAITYAHYAVQISLVGNECLADLPPLGPDAPRRMGPSFGREDGASTMTHMHLRCAKPFGRHIDPARLHAAAPDGSGESGLCMRLVHASVALNLATIAYTIMIIVYGASLRTQMRQRFGIEGSSLRDFLAWWCCMPCAMCQEARTMAVNNVESGVWHGPAAGLPVYYAATEMDAPSLPVMSVDPVKPLKP